MKPVKFLVVLALVLTICLPGVLFAGTTFNNEATFLTGILPGYYLEEFSEYNFYANIGNLQNYTGGSGFSYSVSSDGGLYAVPGEALGAISTLYNTDILSINFTGAPVTAVGGQFFLTNLQGYNTDGQVTVTFSDNTFATVTMSNLTRPFFGYSVFSSELPITSLSLVSIRPDGQDTYYPTIDHLYVGAVGTQAPLPPSGLLLGSGILGLVTLRWRRGRKEG
jgi:hypothetical protein